MQSCRSEILAVISPKFPVCGPHIEVFRYEDGESSAGALSCPTQSRTPRVTLVSLPALGPFLLLSSRTAETRWIQLYDLYTRGQESPSLIPSFDCPSEDKDDFQILIRLQVRLAQETDLFSVLTE